MNLCDSQQLLWRLITAPEGVAKALAEEPQDAALLADTVAGNSDRQPRAAGRSGDAEAPGGELGPVRRLSVYAEAYFTRIHDVLRSNFSDLAEQLGEATFHDLVTSYLAICPPQRPSLRDVGERLPAFLAQGAGGEPFRKRAPWAAALAQLEWLQLDLFDAPDAALCTRRDFEELPAAEWGNTRLQMVPAAELLALDWPVHALCASWPGTRSSVSGEDALRAAPTELLVWRRSETVSYRPLKSAEASALGRVAAGTSFGEVCEEAAARIGEREGPIQAASWLARWLEDGVLARTVDSRDGGAAGSLQGSSAGC